MSDFAVIEIRDTATLLPCYPATLLPSFQRYILKSRSELHQQMDYIFKMCSEQRGIQELGWNLTAPLELVVTKPTPAPKE
jgi:hypothetical protein